MDELEELRKRKRELEYEKEKAKLKREINEIKGIKPKERFDYDKIIKYVVYAMIGVAVLFALYMTGKIMIGMI